MQTIEKVKVEMTKLQLSVSPFLAATYRTRETYPTKPSAVGLAKRRL